MISTLWPNRKLPLLGRRFLRGAWMALTLSAVVLLGCDGGSGDTNVVGTKTVMITPDATSAKATLTPSEGDATQAFSPSQVLQRRDELIGTQVSVTGKVLYTLTCPPPDPVPTNATCIATAYIADTKVVGLRPGDDSAPALLLYEDEFPVSCSAHTLASLTCQGFTVDRDYLVSGVLNMQVLGGRVSNTPILEVESKQAL